MKLDTRRLKTLRLGARRPLLPPALRRLRAAGERPPVQRLLRCVAPHRSPCVRGARRRRPSRCSCARSAKGGLRLRERSCPLRYEGVGEEIVHALKYRGYTRVVDRLAAPLMLGVLDRGERFDAVVPVPLHRSRLRRRGFNQAELLAWRWRRTQRTRFGYTTSCAEDPGSGRALRRREAGQPRGSLRGPGPRAGQDPPRRRRLHHRSDDELGRRDPFASRSGRGTRGEPVQDGMKKHAPASPTLSARFAFSTPPGFARRLSASQLRSARHVASLLCAGCLSEGIWRS
jgi:predicted amidophosphoribosyltransferase